MNFININVFGVVLREVIIERDLQDNGLYVYKGDSILSYICLDDFVFKYSRITDLNIKVYTLIKKEEIY